MRIAFTIFLAFTLSMSLAQQRAWIPDYAYGQYAGSIGFASAGIGYDVFGKHRLSLHYGYVPAHRGGPLNIIASKLIFSTYDIRLGNSLTFHPIDAGLMVTYHVEDQFNSRWPQHRYPDGYYWWRPAWRPHLLTQTSITLYPEMGWFKSVAAYIEFNTNELYLISFLKNMRSLSITDIVKVGVGVGIRVGF